MSRGWSWFIPVLWRTPTWIAGAFSFITKIAWEVEECGLCMITLQFFQSNLGILVDSSCVSGLIIIPTHSAFYHLLLDRLSKLPDDLRYRIWVCINDGAADLHNRYTIGFLALLVFHRVFDKILVPKCAAGHMHGPLVSCSADQLPCCTLSSFQKMWSWFSCNHLQLTRPSVLSTCLRRWVWFIDCNLPLHPCRINYLLLLQTCARWKLGMTWTRSRLESKRRTQPGRCRCRCYLSHTTGGHSCPSSWCSSTTFETTASSKWRLNIDCLHSL